MSGPVAKRPEFDVAFYVIWACTLALPAAAFRMAVTDFQSRYQILIFSILSLAGETLASRAAGRRFDLLRAIVGASAAAMAIVAVKWSIEGFPPVVERLLGV